MDIKQSIAHVRAHILGENSKFVVFRDMNTPYYIDWDNHVISFSYSNSGREKIGFATKQMAHFMLTSDDGLHLDSWGLESPHVYGGLSAFNDVPSPSTEFSSHVDFEVNVCARQHLIEVMIGMRSIDDIQTHNESDVTEALQRHIMTLLKAYPDETWKSKIREHFSQVPEIIQRESTQRPSDNFTLSHSMDLSDEVALCLEEGDYGWKRLSLQSKDNAD